MRVDTSLLGGRFHQHLVAVEMSTVKIGAGRDDSGGTGNTPRIFMCSGVLLLVRSTTKLSPENSTSVCPFSTPTLDTTQSDTTGYSAVVENVTLPFGPALWKHSI